MTTPSEDPFKKAGVQLVLNKPFYAAMVMHLPRKAVDPAFLQGQNSPATAAVDGHNIFYNEEFVKTISDKQRMSLLAACAMCPALGHLWRRGHRMKDLWNRASELVIYGLLEKDGFTLPPSAPTDDRFDGMSVEQVYSILEEEDRDQQQKGGGKNSGDTGDDDDSGQGSAPPTFGHLETQPKPKKKDAKPPPPEKDEEEEPEQEPQSGQGQGESEGEEEQEQDEQESGSSGSEGETENDQETDGEGDGEGQGEGEGKSLSSEGEGEESNSPEQKEGQGDSFDHDFDSINREKAEEEIERWKSILLQAAVVAKMRGTLPFGIARLIDDLTEGHVPWQQILPMFVNEALRDDYNMMKQDRRFQDLGIFAFPELESDGSGIAFIMDTSGSIGQDELRAGASELFAILGSRGVTKVRLMCCDAAVHLDETLTPNDPLPDSFPGGGGSVFIEPFQRIVEDSQKEKPALIVVFTDLDITFPREDPGIPTIWLAATPAWMKEADFLTKAESVPFGTVLRYDPVTEDPGNAFA